MSVSSKGCLCISPRALRSWMLHLRRYSTSFDELSADNQQSFHNGKRHDNRYHRQENPVGSRKSRHSSGDVRFETIRGSLSLPQSSIGESSTITRREGAAFKKLQDLAKEQPEKQQFTALNAVLPAGVDPIAAGKTLPRRNPASRLDAILDAMKLEGQREQPIVGYKSRASPPRTRPVGQVENDLKSTGDAKAAQPDQVLKTPAAKESAKPDDEVDISEGHGMSRSDVFRMRLQWKQQQFSSHKLIRDALLLAKSDVELWQNLQTRIFTPLKALRLNESRPVFDGYPDHRKDPPSWRTLQKPNNDPLEIVGRHFRGELNTAADTLRKNFPTSLFQLALIPELRRMGPAYFALGTSANLYNAALEQLVVQDENMAGALDLLNEMEREVIEPNRRSVDILKRILEHQKAIEDGSYGPAVKMVWATQQNENIIQEVVAQAQKLLDGFRDPEYLANTLQDVD